MLYDHVQVSKLFFQIPKDRINRDVEAMIDNPAPNELATKSIMAGFPRPETTEQAVEFWHQLMVQSHMFRHLGLPEEEDLFSAVYPATVFVEALQAVDFGNNRLISLGQQLRAIKKREGIPEGEYWPPDQMPDDYCSAIGEFLRLTVSMRATVLIELLRRYKLDKYADHYESDRETFENMFEAGERLTFDDEPVC